MLADGRRPYLLRLGRFRQDQSEETQADLLVLGGSFAYLREKNASATGEQGRREGRGRAAQPQGEEPPLKPTQRAVSRAPSSP